MMRKKAAAMVLAIMMAVCGLPESAWANDGNTDGSGSIWQEKQAEEPGGNPTEEPRGIVQSGSCGENATYTLDDTGTLTISGSGKIKDNAFSNNHKIKAVQIGEGITGIGEYTFSNCSELMEIEISTGITSIGGFAFSGCSGLTRIIVEAGNAVYDSREDCNAIIETESNTLISGCKETRIPESITDIGDYAFSVCSGLTGIEIPAGVTSIGAGAFYGCSELGGIKIPSGVTSIGQYAFYGCSGLTGIEIPTGVTEIEYGTFLGCSGLREIKIPSGVTSIGDFAFDFCIGLTKIEIPSSVTNIGNVAFRNCISLVEIKIPTGITSIGDETFSGCSGLTEIKIPVGVTSIGYGSFEGCSGLTGIEIPSGVTSIGEWAFSGCSGLTEIKIPAGVTSIGDTAFDSCKGLTKIEIPSSVVCIGEYTFIGCSELTIYCCAGSYAETYAKSAGIPYEIITSKDEKPSESPNVQRPNIPGNRQEQKPENKIQKPARVKIRSLKKKGANKLQVKWKKIKGVSGYQIQYALNKKFTRGKKNKNVGKTKTSYVIKRLKSDKKYFVRIRAYKTGNGVKKYGKWSVIKNGMVEREAEEISNEEIIKI